jgi:hypothetical protein
VRLRILVAGYSWRLHFVAVKLRDHPAIPYAGRRTRGRRQCYDPSFTCCTANLFSKMLLAVLALDGLR